MQTDTVKTNEPVKKGDYDLRTREPRPYLDKKLLLVRVGAGVSSLLYLLFQDLKKLLAALSG